MDLTEIGDLALEKLGVKAISQDSSTDDQTKAATVAARVYDRIIGKHLAIFASDAVPLWAQSPLAFLAAKDMLSDYSPPADRVTLIMEGAASAISLLNEQVALSNPKMPIRARYF